MGEMPLVLLNSTLLVIKSVLKVLVGSLSSVCSVLQRLNLTCRRFCVVGDQRKIKVDDIEADDRESREGLLHSGQVKSGMTEMSRQTHEIGLLGKELLVATGICSLIRQYSPGFRVASLDLQHHRCSLLCGGGGGGSILQFQEYSVFGQGYCGFSAFLQACSGLFSSSHVRFMDVELLTMIFERYVQMFQSIDFVAAFSREVLAENMADTSRAWWATSSTLDVLARIFHVSIAIWTLGWGQANSKGAGMHRRDLHLQHVAWGTPERVLRGGYPLVHLLYNGSQEHYSVLRPLLTPVAVDGGETTHGANLSPADLTQSRLWGDLQQICLARDVVASDFHRSGGPRESVVVDLAPGVLRHSMFDFGWGGEGCVEFEGISEDDDVGMLTSEVGLWRATCFRELFTWVEKMRSRRDIIMDLGAVKITDKEVVDVECIEIMVKQLEALVQACMKTPVYKMQA